MELARLVWLRHDPWRDEMRVETQELGEEGGERAQSRLPLALGAPPVQTSKGANERGAVFRFTRERAFR